MGYYQYAYPKDSIAHAYIQDSGGVFLPINNADSTHSNFTSIAKAFKCGKDNQVDCLRKIPFKDIQKKVENTAGVSFVPVVDERTRFSDYSKRLLLSKIPKLVSSPSHHLSSKRTLY